MATFSTPESASLERNTEERDDIVNFDEIWNVKNQNLVKKWICDNSFKNICLQFPDGYLPHSTKISDDLTKSFPITKFYILADTSYGSCCVDEVAAQHVEADSLVHFGVACLSKTSRLPILYVYPQFYFDYKNFCNEVRQFSGDVKILFYFGVGYNYVLDEGMEISEKIGEVLGNENYGLHKFQTEFSTLNNDKNCKCVYVGHDDTLFFNLVMTVKASNWYIYDPVQKLMSETTPNNINYIKRRYHYIEKCKDAQTLGLVVATLTTQGYLDIIKRLQEMARIRGKRTYIISVGRINPSKLANFMEIDCFVLIGCPFNNLFTSKEFYKPIISIFDAEMALNSYWNSKYPESYVTDFKNLLPGGKYYQKYEQENPEFNDVSLISGNIRSVGNGNRVIHNDIGTEIAERKNYQLMEQNCGKSFEQRSWKGLDPKLGENEPALLKKGLSGIPINYTHEKN